MQSQLSIVVKSVLQKRILKVNRPSSAKYIKRLSSSKFLNIPQFSLWLLFI